MKTWFDETREWHAEQDRIREEKQCEQEAQAQGRFKTRTQGMPDRLKRIIREMPRAERGKPRSLDFFVQQLKPKYHGARAAPREVAAGLRKLGFERKREWKGGSPFTTLWYAPLSGGR